MNLFKWLFNKLFSVFRPKITDKISDATVLLPIENSTGRYVFFCPGCKANHIINTNPENNPYVHVLTGTLSRPTIRASVLSKGDKQVGKPHCHSFVTDGKIRFLNDCTHELAGKTVNLPPL